MPTPRLEDLPEVREGDVPSAAWLNQLRALVLASTRVNLGPGLAGITGATGTAARAVECEDRRAIRITYNGGGGLYSWVEQVMTTGGGWQDGILKGYAQADPARGAAVAFPAHEMNLTASAAAVNKRVPAVFDPATGRPTFMLSACS